MPFVMRVLAMNQRSFEEEPVYLASYDVEWQDGLGRADFTTDIDKAMRFDTAVTLMKAWRTQSRKHPTRPDGKANRPLTALTVLTEKYEPTTNKKERL